MRCLPEGCGPEETGLPGFGLGLVAVDVDIIWVGRCGNGKGRPE